MAPDILYALFTVFILLYGTSELGLSRGQVLAATLIGSAFQLGLIPLAGAITDRVNRRAVYAVAAVLAGIWPFVFFSVVDGSSEVAFIGCVVVGLAIHSFMYGPQAAFITEQFSPRLRYTGSSLAYKIAGVFGGAVAPLAFTYLLDRTGSWVAPASYLAVAVLLTLIGLAMGRDPDHAEDAEYLDRPVTSA